VAAESFGCSRHTLIDGRPITGLDFLESLFQAVRFDRVTKATDCIVQETFLNRALPTLTQETIPITHVSFVMRVASIVLLYQGREVVPQRFDALACCEASPRCIVATKARTGFPTTFDAPLGKRHVNARRFCGFAKEEMENDVVGEYDDLPHPRLLGKTISDAFAPCMVER